MPESCARKGGLASEEQCFVIASFIAENYHLNSGLQVSGIAEITFFLESIICTTGTQPFNDR